MRDGYCGGCVSHGYYIICVTSGLGCRAPHLHPDSSGAHWRLCGPLRRTTGRRRCRSGRGIRRSQNGAQAAASKTADLASRRKAWGRSRIGSARFAASLPRRAPKPASVRGLDAKRHSGRSEARGEIGVRSTGNAFARTRRSAARGTAWNRPRLAACGDRSSAPWPTPPPAPMSAVICVGGHLVGVAESARHRRRRRPRWRATGAAPTPER